MPTKEARPYQNNMLGGVRKFYVKHRAVRPTECVKILLCGPTGCGKTFMFSTMTGGHINLKFEHQALIVTHRFELLSQAGGALWDAGVYPEVVTSKKKRVNWDARCIVGMVDTLRNRLRDNPHVIKGISLVIIDECHIGNFKGFIRLLEKHGFRGLLVGCSATPLSSNRKDPISNYYHYIVNEVQISELVDLGFLAPCITYSAINDVDKSGLKKDHKGEFTDASNYAAFAKREIYDGLIRRYREICERYNEGRPMRTLCFNVNIKHSLEVMREFRAAGYRAEHLDGETGKKKKPHEAKLDKDARKKIVDNYHAGEYDILCNVGVLTAGFDDPPTQVIIINRATTSIPLYLQCCGRGSRPYPGKKFFIVLDMGANYKELDLWKADRDWEALWCGKKPNKDGVAPTKTCDGCKAIVAASCRICPHCGYEFPVKDREYIEGELFGEVFERERFNQETIDKVVAAETIKYYDTLPVSLIEQIRIYYRRSNKWPVYLFRDKSPNEAVFREKLKQLAMIRGYPKEWVNQQDYK